MLGLEADVDIQRSIQLVRAQRSGMVQTEVWVFVSTYLSLPLSLSLHYDSVLCVYIKPIDYLLVDYFLFLLQQQYKFVYRAILYHIDTQRQLSEVLYNIVYLSLYSLSLSLSPSPLLSS